MKMSGYEAYYINTEEGSGTNTGLNGTLQNSTSYLLGGIVTKPRLIHTPTGDSEEDWIRLNSGSRMSEGVVTITKYMHFKVPEGKNPRMYNDLDVYSHPAFPARYSRLPEDVRYYFTGNATIEHGDDFHYFTAALEYTNSSLTELTISGGTSCSNGRMTRRTC